MAKSTGETMTSGDTTGCAVFLNGTSSSGKTTLARALQQRLPLPFLHVALDQFRDGLPDRYRGLNSPEGTSGAQGLNVVPDAASGITRIVFGEHGQRMLKGMRRAMATMVQSGNNIIIDDIILESAFLHDYLGVFDGLPLYFVGVRCPPHVIEEREAARPGRFPGTAMGHLEVCHAHDSYDIEVNTSTHDPASCASQVITRMQQPPVAFDRLRANQ
jgi:chloramphenicol 3-O phosphotransferase